MRIRLELARPIRSARRDAVRGMMETLARGAGRDLGWASFLAEGFAALGDFDRAFTFSRRLLRADPENAAALALNAAQIYQAQGKHEHAVRQAIESLALVYVQPALHCLLGRSLIVLREWRRAEEAFRVALAQSTRISPGARRPEPVVAPRPGASGRSGTPYGTGIAGAEEAEGRRRIAARCRSRFGDCSPSQATTPGLDLGTVPAPHRAAG